MKVARALPQVQKRLEVSSQKLRAAASPQFLQLLLSFDASMFGGCPQKDFCLFAILGNPVSPQIESRQVKFRGGFAQSNRRPKTRYLPVSILCRIRRLAIRRTVRGFLGGRNGRIWALRINLPGGSEGQGRIRQRLFLRYSWLRFGGRRRLCFGWRRTR